MLFLSNQNKKDIRMISPSCFVTIFVSTLILFILYIISTVSCSIYFQKINIEANIITILIAFIPILNFIIALKAVDWKNVKEVFIKYQNKEDM